MMSEEVTIDPSTQPVQKTAVKQVGPEYPIQTQQAEEQFLSVSDQNPQRTV